MKYWKTGLTIAILIFVGSTVAQEWEAVVLKASSFTDDGSGDLIINLTSGTTLRVPKEDWSNQWSKAVNDAIEKQKMEKIARSSDEPPSDASAASMIRSKCANEWPDDYKMRKYCEDQQYKGLRALRSRQMTGYLSKVRSKCANEWSDDYRMRDYCEENQLKAIRELNR